MYDTFALQIANTAAGRLSARDTYCIVGFVGIVGVWPIVIGPLLPRCFGYRISLFVFLHVEAPPHERLLPI